MNEWIAAGLALAFVELTYWQFKRALRQSTVDHAKCVAHIASVTSNKFVADRVRDMADHYDSMDGQAELARVRSTTGLQPRSIPALWMFEQADRIEAEQ